MANIRLGRYFGPVVPSGLMAEKKARGESGWN